MKHVDPLEVERAAERERIRAAIEARIEKWIELLDAIDGEPDLEPSGDERDADADDEPTLGSRPLLNQERGWADRHDRYNDEVEADTPDGQFADDEPWLGAQEIPAACQTIAWRPGRGFFPVRLTQEKWAAGTSDDREDENEHGTDIDAGEFDETERDDDLCCEQSDNGIADVDGAAEQCPKQVPALNFSVGGYVA